MQHIPGLYIHLSKKGGRGVFTAHEVNKGDVIEICPLILIPADQVQFIDKTIFYDYYYNWPAGEEGSACIALGYGSLYNHTPKPNAEVIFDVEEKTIVIKAVKKIKAHQEIFIDYQGGEEDASGLWFAVK